MKYGASFSQFDQAKEHHWDIEAPSSSPSLIRSELEWFRRPLLDSNSSEGESKATLSRWVQQELANPMEYSSRESDTFYALTLFLNPTRGEWFAGGKPFYKGQVSANALWLKEPSQVVQAVYYQGFTSFRVYLPQHLLAECYEAAYGRAPSTDLIISKSKRVGCPALRRLVQMLVDIDGLGSPAGPVFLDGISLALASRLFALDSKGTRLPAPDKLPTALAKWRLNRSVEYIEANLLRPIYLIELSNAVGLSRMHFAAQFRAATGYSPHRYIIRRKVVHAQTLLRDPAMSVVDVALLLGFRTQAHFTVVFKSIVGHPPAHWRKHFC